MKRERLFAACGRYLFLHSHLRVPDEHIDESWYGAQFSPKGAAKPSAYGIWERLRSGLGLATRWWQLNLQKAAEGRRSHMTLVQNWWVKVKVPVARLTLLLYQYISVSSQAASLLSLWAVTLLQAGFFFFLKKNRILQITQGRCVFPSSPATCMHTLLRRSFSFAKRLDTLLHS